MSNTHKGPKRLAAPAPRSPLAEVDADPSAVTRKLWLIVGVAAVVVAAVVGVGVLLSGGGDDEAATDTIADAAPIVLEFGEVAVRGEPLPLVDAETNVTADDSVGLTAPVVSGTDYTGEAITIDAAENGPTLVVLLAHWCPHCNDEIPVLNEWRDAEEVPAGIDIVGVSTEAAAEAPNFPPGEWLREKDWQWPVLADVDIETDAPGSALLAYGAGGYPGFVLIDGDGVVRWKSSGETPTDELTAQIEQVMADEASTTTDATASSSPAAPTTER